MRRTDVVIIGGGQAGLAMSQTLTEQDIEHVVLERGRTAERWRSERWDSLRLLTPNWQTRLPGFRYRGPKPDAFMSAGDVVRFLEQYQATFLPPIQTQTSVHAVTQRGDGYCVSTDRGTWLTKSVVVATGQAGRPRVPEFAEHLSGRIKQVVPSRYKNPEQLDDGGVLVVGASATGLQLADEFQRSGRSVTLSVGRHTRLPRTYRGRDIMWWLDALGILSETHDQVKDLEASRRQPSLQLVGRADHSSLDLGTLQRSGVALVGRAAGADADRLAFEPDLAHNIDRSNAKLARLLNRIDEAIRRRGWAPHVAGREDIPTVRAPRGVDTLDLRDRGIRTVVWATGFKPHHPWLRLPVFDARGQVKHTAGVTPMAGVYVLGLKFQRKRNSNYIDGVGDDARLIASHISEHLGHRSRKAA